MRFSQLFIHTLREAPADVELPGQQWLVRAGFLRALTPGLFAYLPLGQRVLKGLQQQLCRVFSDNGGQRVATPLLHPHNLRSLLPPPGNTAEPIQLQDSHKRRLELPPDGSAILLQLAQSVVRSYRQLPLQLYAVQPRYRDEQRPRGGLLRALESQALEAVTLAASEGELQEVTHRLRTALQECVQSLDLPIRSAVLPSMTDGDLDSTAWGLAVRGCGGDEPFLWCSHCDYAAHRDVARRGKELPIAAEPLPLEEIHTPDCNTIVDLARFLDVPTSRTAKALFLVADERLVIAIVRGDMDLNEARLRRVLGVQLLGPATEAEIRAAGAEPGYGSPIGVRDALVVVDDLIPQSPILVSGANRFGYHCLNVNYGRDYKADVVADIALAKDGDPCPQCGRFLRAANGAWLVRGQSLGTEPATTRKATFLDASGQPQPFFLSWHEVALERIMGVVAERHHDEHGLCWPAAIAPFQVHLVSLGGRDASVAEAADKLYIELERAGIATLYDDRDERAGVKFNDADLIGAPIRLTLGARALAAGEIEFKWRLGSASERLPLSDAVSRVHEYLSKNAATHDETATVKASMARSL